MSECEIATLQGFALGVLLSFMIGLVAVALGELVRLYMVRRDEDETE